MIIDQGDAYYRVYLPPFDHHALRSIAGAVGAVNTSNPRLLHYPPKWDLGLR